MFKAITLTRFNNSFKKEPLDIGLLVEYMLFYRTTTVVADFQILDQLYHYFGGERLLRLIQEKYLEVVYLEHPIGVFTKKENNIEHHGLIQFSSPQHVFLDEMHRICIGASGKRGAAKRQALRFEGCIRVKREIPIALEGAKESILDQKYLEQSANLIVNELVPDLNLSTKFEFKAYQESKGIAIETNMDFEWINKIYHREISPDHSTISPAYILTHLLNLHQELYFASDHQSELSCSNLSSILGMSKIDYLMHKSKKSRENLDNFTAFVLDNVKSIREAVNANQVDLDKLIQVLEKSRRFKESIENLPPDADLCKAYHDEITKETFFERFPGRAVRYSLFKGLEIAAGIFLPKVIGDVATEALGVMDEFLFDKLLIGWKPNQYINQVKKLVSHGVDSER
jgi:hypothetical protein